jgi:hypothetical protein
MGRLFAGAILSEIPSKLVSLTRPQNSIPA